MKKIISILATPVISLLFVKTSFCQVQQKHFTIPQSDSALFASNEGKSPVKVNTGEADNINSKAVRFFNRDFKNAEAVKWYKLEDGFVSYCSVSGNKTKVFYDKKGRWAGSITSYNDKTMPRDVRAIVRSIYYDYNITHADEIIVDGKTMFKVNIEDEKGWKIIDIVDNEIVTTTEFKK
jgi:hypothetical protein